MDVNPAVYNPTTSGGEECGVTCGSSHFLWGLRILTEEAPLIKEIQIDVDKGNPLI
jgi:hypothetical protein